MFARSLPHAGPRTRSHALAPWTVLGALSLVAAAFAMLFASVAGAAAPVGTITAAPAKSSGTAPLRGPAVPAGAFVNRPTMSMAAYKAESANRVAPGARRAGVTRTAPRTVSSSFGFNGLTQPQCGCAPSDSNSAILGTQIAETVNVSLATYSKSGVQKTNRLFSTITGYSASGLTDPRILSDTTWKRYSAEILAFPTSTSNQPLLLMASKNNNAGASYFVYNLNVGPLCGAPATNPFFDYPQIGQTQDAVVVTGNCFQGNSFVGAKTFAVAKAILYNGLGFSVPVFGVSSADGTATPANVLDQNPSMQLITTNQHMVAFNNPQAGGYATFGPDTAITGFEARATPRAAGQAGCTTTSCQLDTSDGRFVQDSTQFGDQLWNVATYGFGGANGSFATPYWGQFSIAGHNTTQFGAAITDSCSDDFNASLAVSTADKMWINWTSTDPQGSPCGQTFVRQMEGGRLSTTGSGSLSNIFNAFNSAAELTGNFDPNFGRQRWGDTSSMSLDTATNAWSTNNSVVNSSTWGTRIVKVTQ